MTVNAAPVRNVPPVDLDTGQVSVGTSATLIVAERLGRRGVLIANGSSVALYIGNSGVATNTGFKIIGTDGAGIVIPTERAIYGIVPTGTADVSYMELF